MVVTAVRPKGRLVFRLREDGAECSECWCPGPELLLRRPSSMSCYPGVEEHRGHLCPFRERTMQSASTLFAFNSEISLITSPSPMIWAKKNNIMERGILITDQNKALGGRAGLIYSVPRLHRSRRIDWALIFLSFRLKTSMLNGIFL